VVDGRGSHRTPLLPIFELKHRDSLGPWRGRSNLLSCFGQFSGEEKNSPPPTVSLAQVTSYLLAVVESTIGARIPAQMPWGFTPRRMQSPWL
jgi:hypothetical protein